MKAEYAYLVVYSTSHALMYEKMLMQRDISCNLVPVPRHISSDCGVCVRFQQQDTTAVEEVIAESRIEAAGIFT